MSVVWKFLSGGGWVVIVLAVGAAWLHATIRKAEARGAALEAAKQVQLAEVALKDSLTAFRARDSVATALQDRLQASFDSALTRVRRARRSARVARGRVDSVLRGLAGQDSVILAAAFDTVAGEAAACGLALAICDSSRGVLQAQLIDTRLILLRTDTVRAQCCAVVERLKGQVGGAGTSVLTYVLGAVAVVVTLLHFTR